MSQGHPYLSFVCSLLQQVLSYHYQHIHLSNSSWISFYILEIHNRVATRYHAWICKMDWLTTSLQKVGLDIVPLKLSSSSSNIKVRKIWTKRFLRFCPLTTFRLNLIPLFHQLLIIRGTRRRFQIPFKGICFLCRFTWKYFLKKWCIPRFNNCIHMHVRNIRFMNQKSICTTAMGITNENTINFLVLSLPFLE